jgi:hypothetical protein
MRELAMIDYLMFDQNKKRIYGLLLSLGTSKDDIEKNLVKDNIEGKPYSALLCPIVKYLEKHIPNKCFKTHTMFVGGNETVIKFYDGIDTYSFSLSQYPQLKALHNFIVDFDNGRYPKLTDDKLMQKE